MISSGNQIKHGNETELEIRDLSFSYEKEPVLDHLSLQMRGRESVGLIGSNGVGKSTLLKLLVGLESGYEGSIRIGGLPVLPENYARVREMIGYVFQDSESQLFMTTVEEDVAFAPRNYGLSPEETEERVRKALEAVHMEHLRKRSVYALSGGEKKLVSIATILSVTPSLILLDEPSEGLDPKNRRNLIRVLNELDTMKLITSHDLDLIWDTCSRVLLLDEGKIVYDGPAEGILTDKEQLEAHGLELPLSLSRQAPYSS